MNKFSVVIYPHGLPPVSYKVGGFDADDALTQARHRWVLEQGGRRLLDIESVCVVPLEDVRAADAIQVQSETPNLHGVPANG